VLVVGVQMLAVVMVETWYGFGRAPAWLMLVQSLIIVAAVLGTGAALLDTDTELLAGPSQRPQAQLSPAEHVLKQKLDAAMADAVYREPGLTIGTLADRLGTPEHRLRALINRRLGYRNFSAFLNAHRIAEAQALLADPARVDLPVLTIAMDLGYGSLAPFNRAFREATAQTPTDFRRAAIVGPEKS
jgi:AraC-like DNA-binding protein